MSDNPCVSDYDVSLIKMGVPLAAGKSRIEKLNWGRSLDQISRAGVSFITAGDDCCGQLDLVDHFNTDLVVSTDGNVRWRGPVTRVEYSRGRVNVEAADLLEWLNVRFIRDNLVFSSQDVSNIFVGIWNSAVNSIDAPVHELIVRPSGVIESSSFKANNNSIAMKKVREMLDSGLDLTTVGSRILVGIMSQSPIELGMNDVQGNVTIVKDGDIFANRVATDASNGNVGIYPSGTAKGINGYPLVEYSNYAPNITDISGATNASKSRYDLTGRGVRRVHADGGLVLLPSINRNPRDWIAGMPINFTADETCYKLTETFRLGSINFEVSAGRETATIELQPLGALQGLSGE